jgi:hypothetical protein
VQLVQTVVMVAMLVLILDQVVAVVVPHLVLVLMEL